MIKTRLFSLVQGAGALVAQSVALQWLSLVTNAIMVFTLGSLLQDLFLEGFSLWRLLAAVGVCVVVAGVRYVVSLRVGVSSHQLAFAVKRSLRERLYSTLLAIGPAYTRYLPTSEAVQLAGEGIEQLEVYFSKYLPQLFYCLVAPLTLFVVFAFIDIKVALVLLACVPLIPLSILIVQRRAKAAFQRYWGNYTDLGGSFLEGLQALTTLKVYQADAAHQRRMERDAEAFRVATMRVLRLQLLSVTVMDAIAYGGAAAGIIIAVLGFAQGAVSIAGCFTVIVLSAEFFIPLRQLGSLFHIAMNGMSAADRIFALIDLPQAVAASELPQVGVNTPLDLDGGGISAHELGFAYGGDGAVLAGIDLAVGPGAPVALVGESGSGKSTLAALVSGRLQGYTGSLRLGGVELSALAREQLMRAVVLVSDKSYLFKGTVRENLLIALPGATDAELWQALEQVSLDGLLRQKQGLDTALNEGASNLSGGQRQRLALARALLAKASVYIFDEATSNIDTESEALIMKVVFALARQRPTLLISHRLANVKAAACIYVLKAGRVVERGSHEELLKAQGTYALLYSTQRELEDFSYGAALAPQKELCHV